MHVVKKEELDVVLNHSPIEAAIVSKTKDGDSWIVTIRVRNGRSQLLEDYQLLTARGERKTWRDPRPIFNMLQSEYGIRQVTVQLAS